MTKFLAMGATSLAALLLNVFIEGPPGPPEGPPPPKAKKKAHEPGDDLRKAHDLLTRLRAAEEPSGRPGPRLRDWTERATELYKKGVKAFDGGDPRLAHEYGAAAHDLARAVDHARNAERFDKPDADLPPPPDGPGPRDHDGVRDLRRAYDRIVAVDRDDAGREAKFYLDAARDLYNAARRDAEKDRDERAGELARAAEAMTHVPEHLAHAQEAADGEPTPPREKVKEKEKEAPKRPRRDDGPRGELPPPLPR